MENHTTKNTGFIGKNEDEGTMLQNLPVTLKKNRIVVQVHICHMVKKYITTTINRSVDLEKGLKFAGGSRH